MMGSRGIASLSIEGVPPGRYVVLAAFENDDLVRDPDESIGGTDIVHIEVNGTDIVTDGSFEVTEALSVVAPGADALEIITDATPTIIWANDSSEKGYELRIYDAFGELVLEDTEVPPVSGSATVSYAWEDAELQSGMIYQFRVVSWAPDKDGRKYLSATEDLRGVFQYQSEE